MIITQNYAHFSFPSPRPEIHFEQSVAILTPSMIKSDHKRVVYIHLHISFYQSARSFIKLALAIL